MIISYRNKLMKYAILMVQAKRICKNPNNLKNIKDSDLIAQLETSLSRFH